MSEFLRLTGLALADSVNPCAIAVLVMILTTILIQNPDKRKKVLLGGLAFVLSVYIGYLVYGLIIVQFFKTFAVFLRENSKYVFNGLAALAILIGALNIKDYLNYKKGSFATEMPLFMRPKIKKITARMTSPSGAFFTGFIVTLFLLPCTIGPYIVASGLLSNLPLFNAVLWLLYYNLVFVLPMLLIVILIYKGFTKVDEVAGWKERNIKKLHLIAGTLLVLMGLALLMGWL